MKQNFNQVLKQQNVYIFHQRQGKIAIQEPQIRQSRTYLLLTVVGGRVVLMVWAAAAAGIGVGVASTWWWWAAGAVMLPPDSPPTPDPTPM